MSVVTHERESTFKVPITGEFFDKIYKLTSSCDNNISTVCLCIDDLPSLSCNFCKSKNDTSEIYSTRQTVILIFGDGTRLASRVYQSKRIESRTYVAVFMDGNFFPILRTHAIEKLEKLPKSTKIVPDIIKSVYRIILTRRGIVLPDGVTLRFSFNKEEDSIHGTYYNMACETEYPMTSNYGDIVRNERTMLREYYDFIKLARVPMNAQTLNDLFASVVPKVQMWSCFNPELPYRWAYKWNGIKAKFMVKNDRILLWPDAATVQTLRYEGDLSAIDKIIFQVELMPTCIVLIHAISVSFFNKIYNIEPYTGIDILNYLHAKLHDIYVTYENEPSKKLPLIVQRFYDDRPCPKSFSTDTYDGFILAQELLFIKWKQPTIDAEYMGKNTFKVGDDKKPILFKLDDNENADDICVEHNIYELSSKLSILRRRIDRLLCSTTKEYELFIKSVKLLNKE